MALLGRRRGSSAMDCSPRYTANLLPSSSRMELHPPAGDADPWLHRNYLSPRPHRPVSTGSSKTEPKVTSPAGQARLLQDCTPTPHVFPRLFEVQELTISSWDLAAGRKYGNAGKRGRPHAHAVWFYEANDRTRRAQCQAASSGLMKFIKILLVFRVGFDKMMLGGLSVKVMYI